MSRKMRNIIILISMICYIMILSACFTSAPSTAPTVTPSLSSPPSPSSSSPPSTAPSATTTILATLAPTVAPTATLTPTLTPTPTPTIAPRAAPNDFSLLIDDQYISVKEWDDVINVEEILGKPLSTETKVLGGNSDTLAGSFVKTLEFDGLQMTLFSPEANGKSSWIMSMEVSKKGYKSLRSIEVGNTVEELNKAYPDIKIGADGRTDPNNCMYEISSEEMDYNLLTFEVENGVVVGIKIFHMIN